MGRISGRFLVALLAAGVLLATTAADGRAYLGAKAGVFVPNGASSGLQDFETGYGGELFLGGDVGPVSVELGLGGYSTEPDGGGDALDTGYVAGTGKLYLPLLPLTFYGGGGVGYYLSRVRDGDHDGSGTGVHLVGGAELTLGLVSVLAELRWNRVELEFVDGRGKDNVGGLLVSLGVIF